MAKREGLAKALKSLVKTVEATLGEVVLQAEGRAFFDAVEGVRQRMVQVRTREPKGQRAALIKAKAKLGELSVAERSRLARAYTIYLELVNVCENAYRTHRLRSRWRARDEDPPARANMVFVLTAHPTESRSVANIGLMRRTQDLLVEALERGSPPEPAHLMHLLHLVWRAGTHPPHKPTVADEAAHLFSLISDPILVELLDLRSAGHSVRLRTWVGGDKDGHPGVGPEETSASFNLSRARLLEFVRGDLLEQLREDVALLPDSTLNTSLRDLVERLGGLRQVSIGDGRRVEQLRSAGAKFAQRYARRRGQPHPSLTRLNTLLELFPGLVIPLELREERGLFAASSPIADMLHFVGDVARGGQVDWYVRGCVVSMTGCPQDLWEAEERVRAVLGGPALRIIPLFELPDVLLRATEILEGAMESAAFRGSVDAHERSLEVMLGYSDTSKRMGVLASRLSINTTMKAIGAWGERRKIRIDFFHGSGGSVGRGGGSVADRAATWPSGASGLVKQTLQGEMVERTLATPEILRSQVEQIAGIQAAPPRPREISEITRLLAAGAEETYAEVVSSTEFHELLSAATPYTRLGTLTIGSRPVNRKKAEQAPKSLEQLRAIPWVLCWTQTRYLLHAWLGVGSAWRSLRKNPENRRALTRALKRDPLLRSYLRMLGFTLAKMAPLIWNEYVAALAPDGSKLLRRLEREWRDALDLALQLTGQDELLSYRPWLRESIRLRAPMIHPLNLLQIEVLKRARLSQAEQLLFRETVTGIAAGMLTTG